jgi:hypothetical protein
MGKILLWIGQTHRMMIFDRDRLKAELRSRGCEVLVAPNLDVSTSVRWINDRARKGDVAFALHDNITPLPETSLFYIANNLERKKHAELILLSLLRRLPRIFTSGVQSDTLTQLGSLDFCRQVNIPSLVMQLNLSHNSNEVKSSSTIKGRSVADEFVSGLADGLIAWSQDISSGDLVYPNIAIELNHKTYEEQGILVNGNACIPIDLCDRLGMDCTQLSMIRYRGIVYINAIELRNFNISVRWDNLSQTVILRSLLSIARSQIDSIMSAGYTSEVQMIVFLKANNETALDEFRDLPKIYREEGSIEGVNHDIAFSQMCWETHFLRDREFQNNFAKLGLLGGSSQLASFADLRLGVRSHIQHLKAYASMEPLVQEAIDPRFHLVRRGIANKVTQLSARWSADLFYGDKIMAILRRLYESANLL